MFGSYYEEQSPDHEYAMKDIKTSFESWNYPQLTLHMVHEIIEKCVDTEYKQYNSFGSYRGYYTWSRGSILKNVKIHAEKRIRQIALEKIQQNPIFINWVNHVLYRPPDMDGQNAGIRYAGVKEHFTNMTQIQHQNDY
jgi:hypothetical protein